MYGRTITRYCSPITSYLSATAACTSCGTAAGTTCGTVYGTGCGTASGTTCCSRYRRSYHSRYHRPGTACGTSCGKWYPSAVPQMVPTMWYQSAGTINGTAAGTTNGTGWVPQPVPAGTTHGVLQRFLCGPGPRQSQKATTQQKQKRVWVSCKLLQQRSTSQPLRCLSTRHLPLRTRMRTSTLIHRSVKGNRFR